MTIEEKINHQIFNNTNLGIMEYVASFFAESPLMIACWLKSVNVDLSTADQMMVVSLVIAGIKMAFQGIRRFEKKIN